MCTGILHAEHLRLSLAAGWQALVMNPTIPTQEIPHQLDLSCADAASGTHRLVPCRFSATRMLTTCLVQGVKSPTQPAPLSAHEIY
jgi:hypothetical protein